MASDRPSERHSGALPTAGWLAPQTSGYTGLVGGDAFAAAGGLTPDDFDSPEKRHARELHGRDMFVIGLPVERLEE